MCSMISLNWNVSEMNPSFNCQGYGEMWVDQWNFSDFSVNNKTYNKGFYKVDLPKKDNDLTMDSGIEKTYFRFNQTLRQDFQSKPFVSQFFDNTYNETNFMIEQCAKLHF